MTDSKKDIPREIGGYQIVDILGEGGMSVVYTAMQEHPRRKVALKVLRGGIFSPTASRRFHLEVEILGKLDHPWIAKIYNSGTHDDGNGATPYFVMEHVADARELTPYLEEESLSRRDILKLFAKISSAIEHGHHRGIVHRDLKPGNILVDAKGDPKIIDFGVARSLDSGTVSDQAMTEAGRLVGTVQFMAPEQVDPKISDIDARCDVYALGVVLYQMLTGRLPRVLEGMPIYEAVRQICEEEPVRPTAYDNTVDANIEAIIMKSIHHDRERRYQTAGAMGRDILRYLGNLPIKARRVGKLDRAKLFCRRHRKPILVVSTTTLFVAATLTAFLYRQGIENARVEELQAAVAALTRAQEDLPEDSIQQPEIIPPKEVLRMPGDPTSVAVSGNGSIIVAAIGEEFYAWKTDGTPLALPPMNVDPTFATVVLSQDGQTLGIVSDTRCRIVDLDLGGEGESVVTARFERPLAAAVSIAVNQTSIAIAGDNMTLELLEVGQKIKRAASMSGQYMCIMLPTRTQVIAATPNNVLAWRENSFPKGKFQMQGVLDPVAVGIRQDRPVVVGSDGVVVVCSSTAETRFTLPVDGEISHASISPSGLLLACVVEGTPYLCDLLKGEAVEIDTHAGKPVGVSINDAGTLVYWTILGEVFVVEQVY